MAFKIFKPKKYHVGMTGDEVKEALKNASADLMPMSNDLNTPLIAFTQDETLSMLRGQTVIKTTPEMLNPDLGLNGLPAFISLTTPNFPGVSFILHRTFSYTYTAVSYESSIGTIYMSVSIGSDKIACRIEILIPTT